MERQARKEWGQGWGAFGERFGSNLAYNGIRQTITYGTSVLFHEDNRYFASHKQGVGARTGYALLSTVTARKPDGSRAISISSIAGVLGASAAASIWGPRKLERRRSDGTGRRHLVWHHRCFQRRPRISAGPNTSRSDTISETLKARRFDRQDLLQMQPLLRCG